MLKYKDQIQQKLGLCKDQLEKIVTWIQYDRINKEEHTKYVENIINTLDHCENLVDLEEG